MKILNNNFTNVADNVITIKDINGKKIETNINYFTDFSTDMSNADPSLFNDSNEYRIKEFSTIVKDSEGETYEIGSPNLLRELNDGEVIALDVVIESTHSGENLNCVNYTEDSMVNDCESWTTPFEKPFIKNHDRETEPTGRVTQAYYSDSEIVEGRGTINLKVRISDKDAMVKFADGRYKTVSVSGNARKVTCNICGKNIVKDGVVKFCGHFKGNSYGGKKSVWQMEDINYKECSIVNEPADVFAQVKEINLIKMEDSMAKKCKPKKDKTKKKKVCDSVVEVNEIDSILDEDDNVEENEGVVEDTKPNKVSSEIKSLEDKIEELEEKIEELEDQIEELEEANEEANEVADTNKKLAKTMATLNKQLIIKNIMILDDSAKERVLKKKKVSELSLMLEKLEDNEDNEEEETTPTKGEKTEVEDEVKDEVKVKTTTETIKTVENPSLAIKDNHDVKDEDIKEKKSKSKNIFDIWGN